MNEWLRLLFLPDMHPLRHIIICVAGCFFSTALVAQTDVAVQKFSKALQYRLKKNDSLAYRAMNEAIASDAGYAEAYSTLGSWYFTDRKYAAATEVFVRASRSCKNGSEAFALPLARSLLYDYKPGQAMQIISGHAMRAKAHPEWLALRRQAQFMQQALAHPLKDTVYNLGPRINTRYPELHPFISADTMHLYFTRKRRNVDMDCYRTQLDTCGEWMSGGNLGSPTNTPDHEAAQTVSADGHYLFYMRCDNRSENGWEQGGCDLFMAYTADSVWSIGQSFGATINTPAYEGMPCLSPDNRELYYVSDRPGGYGGMDIWMSRFEDGLWQQPRNLGPHINTPGDETTPFIHTDNRTLYFSGTGHPGMGGADIYYCRRINDSTWSAPVNMGYPINTSANESGISVTMDGSRAYLASDRDSLTGNYDIYTTKLPALLQPEKVVVIKGYVYDSLTKDRLNYASVNIFDAQTGNKMYRFVSNRGDATFMITLPAGKKYTYAADRVGYLEHTDTLMLVNTDSSNVIQYDISLLPQGYVAPVFDSLLATIHFPTNSFTLTDSDKHIIQTIIEPWLADKGFVVLVNGYTDNTGTPMINEQLSATRAKVVAEEVMGYGIDEMSVQTQGWGEAAPVASNDTEAGRDLNRRVEIIIRR